MRKLSNFLIPLPKKIEEGAGVFKLASFAGRVAVRLGVKCDLTRSAREIIEKKLRALADVSCDGVRGDYKISIKVDALDPAFEGTDSDEAYYVKTGKRETVLVGKCAAGAFYAAVTLSEMLELVLDDVAVKEAYVFDYPDMKYRGHTLESRYGTEFLSKEDYFDIIDYFSAQKINRLCLTLYDCWNYQYDNNRMQYLYIPIPGHPEIVTPKNMKYYSVKEGKWVHKENVIPVMYREKYLPEVIAYAKKRNIVIIPQINTLGHNNLVPGYIHEISAKNEDGTPKGQGYCTMNPATYEFMFSWIDDIIDNYILPFGNDEIHFGLDEVGEAYKCQCPKCRDLSRTEIFLDYAIKLIQYAKSRGMKHVFLCHDMFLELDAVTDENKKRFEDAGVDDVAVLDWWTYEDPTAGLFFGKADKVRPILRSRIKPYTSYQNWTCAQDTHENIRGCMKVALEHGFEGSDAYGTFDYSFDKNFETLADLSWNNGEVDNVEGFDSRYAEKNYPKNREAAGVALRAMRDIMIDEAHNNFQSRINRWLEYYNFCYRVKKTNEDGTLSLELKNFPGEPYDRLLRSDRVDVAYLELILKNTRVAIDFFENSGRYDRFNDTWLLTARHYNRLADEYLSVLGAYKMYEDGTKCPAYVISVLNRLIDEREKLMAFAEGAKMRANSYTYLRNMSVFRQYLIDLRDYFKREISAGRRPKMDITNLDYAMSEKFFFLR